MELKLVPRVSSIPRVDARKLLVDRVAKSSYISRSARLRDLLVYLCDRVIIDGVDEIHEQEVGSEVFGRPRHYDTGSDNIVRVHASTLRKRLDQFFSEEGRHEPVVIELLKGNYAPVFREKSPGEPAVLGSPFSDLAPLHSPPAASSAKADLKFKVLAVVAAIFACATAVLAYRTWAHPVITLPGASLTPVVRQFWSGIFVPGQSTDIVLDDAALALFQELDHRTVSLSEYFDRSYFRRLNEKPEGPLSPELGSAIVLKRQSSYSSAHLLWDLSRTAAAFKATGSVHFARDYSFRELKANRGILLGNGRSNPWIEPFESRLGIRWEFDPATETYFPFDTVDRKSANRYRPSGEHSDGYSSVAFVPNLGGAGSFLILSGTGGAAAGAAAAFLGDEESMRALRNKLPGGGSHFPYFEALLRFPSRSRLPRDATIVFCRPPRS